MTFARASFLLASTLLVACGGDAEQTDSTTGGGGSAVSTTATGGEGTGTTTTGEGGGSTGAGGSAPFIGTCADPAPEGAVHAAPLPAYSGGTCPALVAGSNDLPSGGATRRFVLVVPSDLGANETVPLVFLWHWLGGDPEDFVERGDVQSAVDTQRFIAVAPASKGDLQFQWPVSIIDSDSRAEEDFAFFDDMLACVAEQFSVNTDCVSSVGVSAGALFTDQLAGGRGDRLSSIVSLSGGVGGVIKPFGNPEHRMPALVLWGGPTDDCVGVLSFQTLSTTLESDLTSRGHFLVECVHNCGHSTPPFEPSQGSLFGSMWQFAFDHPFWLSPGVSPYQSIGLPAGMPAWCGIGKGGATPREGECINPSEC
jgi:predicted esterase